MRQLISLRNVNRWRVATGWDVVGGLVRGGTDHRLDLIFSDGSIVHVDRDGAYSLCHFTTKVLNAPPPSILKPLCTLPLSLPEGKVLRDHSRARPSRSAYCGRFHWRHDGTRWGLVNVTRPETLPGLQEVRNLVAELAASPIGEGRRQLEERSRAFRDAVIHGGDVEETLLALDRAAAEFFGERSRGHDQFMDAIIEGVCG